MKPETLNPEPWTLETHEPHRAVHGFARGSMSSDGETKSRENGSDGGQSDVDDDAPLVFRILSHDSFLLMMSR